MKSRRILYIIGAGRSGTTLLEIMLGNAETIINTGELNRYPYRNGIAEERQPGSPSYEFWNDINTTLSAKYDLEEQEKLHKQFEYHTGFVKNILRIRPKGAAYERYKSFLADLYDLIFSKTDSPILTDSSKYPGRAVNLPESVPYEISYLYIKRDPVKVVHSFAKKGVEQDSKGWLSANLYYLVVNFLCRIAIRKLKKKHKVSTVKYEELIERPLEVITRLETDLQIDLQAIAKKLRHDEYLEVCPYIFDGNRIRLKPALKIQKPKKGLDTGLSDRVTKLLNLIHYH